MSQSFPDMTEQLLTDMILPPPPPHPATADRQDRFRNSNCGIFFLCYLFDKNCFTQTFSVVLDVFVA